MCAICTFAFLSLKLHSEEKIQIKLQESDDIDTDGGVCVSYWNCHLDCIWIPL